MRDERKTKKQLIDELVEARLRISKLETLENERMRMETELQASMEKLQQISLAMPDGVVVSDLNGVIVTAFSKSAMELDWRNLRDVTTLHRRPVET